MTEIEIMGKRAKEASYSLETAGEKKNKALLFSADALEENEEAILRANKTDLDNAHNNGINKAMADRLTLTPQRIKAMAQGLRSLSLLPDPVGRILQEKTLKNRLYIEKISVPIGVVGIIYEARPNVTCDASAICLKSGNAVILKGGSEAICSNIAICEILRNACFRAGLPEDCIQLIKDTSRNAASELMKMTDYLDVLIPRGGKGLIKSVKENSRVPVIETGWGNCHIYVDSFADIEMSANIVDNAKTSRVSVCNALETLLIHKDIAKKALPIIKSRLDAHNVKIHGCEKTIEILGDTIVKADEQDWNTEYLDYELACKVVDSIDEAIAHIRKYSSSHSEAIITNNPENSEKFLREVNSAAVYVNASTRFTDGGEFDLGAEIGISTQKLHARGPMGLEEMTSYKYVVRGNGQIR